MHIIFNFQFLFNACNLRKVSIETNKKIKKYIAIINFIEI